MFLLSRGIGLSTITMSTETPTTIVSTLTSDVSGTARRQLVQLSTILAANGRHLPGILDRRRVDWQALDGRRPEHCMTLAQRTLQTAG